MPLHEQSEALAPVFDRPAALRGEAAQVNYVTLAAGTVVPEGASTEGAAAHVATWPIAYAIEGPREWLFAQAKA